MQRVAVITDSIACLTKELLDEYSIEVIPINLYFRGKRYRDGVDLSVSEAYEMFQQDPESFKTSAPSPRECLEAFRRAGERAADILCVTVSAKLSTVPNVARDACEMARDELPGLNITVLDSLTAAAAEGFVALAAARAAAAGKDLNAVLGTARAIRERVNAFLLLDTIRHVYRSGRIPKIASQVGSILNIRPVLTIHETVHFAGAVRSNVHGIRRILEMTRAELGDQPAHISVMHAYAGEEARELMQQVSREFNSVELWLSEFSPIMGYACGTGTLGLAFYPEGV
ncbi:MAG: DegV family protein [Chloroflexota bacterium]